MERTKEQQADNGSSSSDEDKQAAELADAKASAGDALGQTIVTSRKIVIDEATGKVSLSEEIPATSAEAQGAPDAIEEMPTVEPQSIEELPPAKTVPLNEQGEPEPDEAAAEQSTVVEEQESEVEAATPGGETAAEDSWQLGSEVVDADTVPEVDPVAQQDAASESVTGPVPSEPLPETDQSVDEQNESSGDSDSEEIPAAQVVAGSDPTKAHKRLSAETLFEFALPETVRKDGSASLDAATTADEEQIPTTSPDILVPKNNFPIKTVGLVAAVVGLAVVAFFVISTSEEPASQDPASGVLEVEKKSPDTATEQSAAAAVDAEPVDEQGTVEPASENSQSEQSKTASVDEIDTSDVGALSDDQLLLLLSTDDEAILDRAVREAASRGTEELSGKLLELADDDNMLVRVSVAKAFALPKSYPESMKTKVLTTLRDMLDDPEYLVRGFAAKALGASRDSSAKPDLEKRLAVEKNGVVRQIIEVAIDEL